MPVLGTPRSFHNKFMFSVEFDGVANFCFHKAGPLEAKVKKIEFRPGCTLSPDKSAGDVEFEDITLERGVQTGDVDMSDWFKEVIDAQTGKGVAGDNYKRNGYITQKDRDGTPLKRWEVIDAWPCEYKPADFDASATSDKTIESAKLCCQYWREIPVE